MLASTLIVQNLYGESQGVRILKNLYDREFSSKPDSSIAKAVQSQIADESRHVKLFSNLLNRYILKEAGARPPVAPAWEKILNFIRNDGSLTTVIIGVYGLIEPFNLIASKNLLLPLLDDEDREQVCEALSDEEAHVAMLPQFFALMRDEGQSFDRTKISIVLQLFLDAQRAGITLPDNKVIRLPEAAQKQFISHVRGLLKHLGRENVA